MSRPIHDDLPERFTNESAPIIATVRGLLEEVAASLELRPREVSRRRRTCEGADRVGDDRRRERGTARQLRRILAKEIDPSVAERLGPTLVQSFTPVSARAPETVREKLSRADLAAVRPACGDRACSRAVA